ncbi:MAG: hypothetical protein QNJ68_00360 [Microcoleaceae cyanobacterium MO_207.B10]|nr:hypothetical protein [Microcoleaceae cyanobacterium MO_207.B10]
MKSNQISEKINQEKLEQLNALTKVMLVSLLWQGSGLMETKKSTQTDSKADRYSAKK